MEWKDSAGEITQLLGLEGSPIAVVLSDGPPRDAVEGKFWPCQAIQEAANGKVIDLTASTCSCYGGLWHIGFRKKPEGRAWEALEEFIVKGEKLFSSEEALARNQEATTPPPADMSGHLVFSPLEKAEAEPVLVIFICNALQACRLITLDGYQTGQPPKIDMAGSTCHQAIAYPLVSGELNVSLMDYTARRMRKFKPDQLIVSIPYRRFLGVMQSIDHCTAGRGRMEFPKAFRRMMRMARGSRRQ